MPCDSCLIQVNCLTVIFRKNVIGVSIVLKEMVAMIYKCQVNLEKLTPKCRL